MFKKVNSLEEYNQVYQESVQNPEKFWSEIAEKFHWIKKWDKVLDWNFEKPDIKWFLNGKLNLTENCIDRHLEKRGDQVAIIWEPNDINEKAKSITYQKLHSEVCRLSNVLLKKGVRKGDRVVLYMPMVPELAFACLACARIGAVHSVVFAGFSATALADRINDAQAVAVLTSDGNFRGNKQIAVKDVVDDALRFCNSVQFNLVLQRTKQKVNWNSAMDLWWHEELSKVDNINSAEEMDSEDMLFILYTSGSTGKPKGVVHTTGGYMVYTAYTFQQAFGYQEKEIFWCTADIGWITGHSYLLYAPLLNGGTTLMFEGVPNFPDAGRFWEVCEKHKVNIFYTAPTAIRSLMASGKEWADKYKLESLRVLGSVGEPINEEAWHWYHEHVGKGKCQIIDTWWQTETGGFMIAPIEGATPQIPTYATLPLPGVQLALMDAEGNEIKENDASGNLCIKFPWPSILRTTYGDHERCKQTYFSTYPSYYFTGDGCYRNKDGFYRITGRVDDVLNVSGHRLGTAEIENALDEHPKVIESAVIGYPHPIKGQGIYAFLICENGVDESIKFELDSVVSKVIGPIAKPDKFQIVSGLPKTRSGKIMRRILRKIAEDDIANIGDTSTLIDPSVVDEIVKGRK